jgi:hypothetical protein
MSNREALRKLSRRLPTRPEVEAIMAGLRGKSDLEIAIIAPAICESALEKLIEAKFKIHDKNLTGRIFLNRGPLSDFDSKILISHAFAIITSPMADQLHSIQAIRNTFAHAKLQLEFDHELIDREIKTLRMPAAIKGRATDQYSKELLQLPNKQWFLLTVRITLIMLESLVEHPGTADEAIAEALKT